MATPLLSFPNLVRTMSAFFRIGAFRLKDSSGVVQLRNGGDTAWASGQMNSLKLNGANATNKLTLQVPTLGGDVVLTLPDNDGNVSDFLQTDGSGVLSWQPGVANADLTQTENFTQATASPLTIFTCPANYKITKVVLKSNSVAGSTAATLKLGVTGTPNAIFDTTDCDLTDSAAQVFFPEYPVGGSPIAIIATIVTGSQTFDFDIDVTYALMP